jgi:GntR family transcriptional regulator, transcriptional repressor for pyruvate dehydrogenase complex
MSDSSGRGASARQLRQPRLAEIVAAHLRDDILNGRLKEGDSLPRQEDLYNEFRVSPPPVREAMRILETEGLISVRRGNVGGAVVHVPTEQRTAYMFSMVLQIRETRLDDVSAALLHLEPVCAGLCAARPDRMETVVPALTEAIARQQEHINDTALYASLARQFHETLVQQCGNTSMIVMIGALESIWTAHEKTYWGEIAAVDDRTSERGSALTARSLRAALRDHEKLLAAIEAGAVDKASSLAGAHLAATRASSLASGRNPVVTANLVGGDLHVE